MIVATDTTSTAPRRDPARLLGGVRPRRRRRHARAARRGLGGGVPPMEPQRSVYNNALLAATSVRATARAPSRGGCLRRGGHRQLRGMGPRDRRRHARRAQRPRLHRRGDHALDGHVARGRLPHARRAPIRSTEVARVSAIPRARGVPEGLLSGADSSRFHLLMARLAGDNIATAMAFDHDGDCVCSTSRPSSTRGDAASEPR